MFYKWGKPRPEGLRELDHSLAALKEGAGLKGGGLLQSSRKGAQHPPCAQTSFSLQRLCDPISPLRKAPGGGGGNSLVRS